MRAIIIDAEKKEIREVDFEGSPLKFMQGVVDGLIEPAIDLPNFDTVYVDEEGLLKERDYGGFEFEGAHQPFAGNGVVVGTNTNSGATISAGSLVQDIQKKVTFF